MMMLMVMAMMMVMMIAPQIIITSITTISLNEAAAPREATMAAAGSRWPARLHRAWAQAGAQLPAGAPAGSNSCKCSPLIPNG